MRCSRAAISWHRREAFSLYGWAKPICESTRYQLARRGLAAHIRRDLSHQVRDIAKEGRDQIALLSRQVEVNSTKIDTHQVELSRSIRATEINSNEVRVLATQQNSKHQEILAAIHESTSDIRSLADDWQSLGTTVSLTGRFQSLQKKDSKPNLRSKLHKFRDILESNHELSRVILQVASTRNTSSTGLEQCNPGEMFKLIQQDYHGDNPNDTQKSEGTGGTRCTCRAYSRLNYREPLSMLHFKSVFRKQHYSNCPKFRVSDESLEYTIKIVPPTWLLSHTISLSLVLRNWSSGRGWAIAPVVIGTSRIVDRSVSPGFQTVRAHMDLLESPHFENSTKFVESLERSLRDVLTTGQSSPLDEDRDGNTLLYVRIMAFHSHI